ncbi:Holliday junction branch migration protein RuvA [Sinimarinibacterium sp. NLF-5-8]|uniref:Holliday junction branch migration protein RuvA n=1 Tax=Sinimarinibacterium sp. NLF-5-8 TaxID=2698684 RepID=UPI00137BBCFE|nr:Holliday junction branch migration protein RuvA [Sinimarinibacterium sp. NLF-5-8]QHS08744.1 Holliday junction branch migration protein RuvA [Sinimarinibacterium sp. NLF-5-8]
MIGRLQGRLLSKQPPALLIDVGGVGYEVEAPMSTFYQLPPVGETAVLHTHLVVRDDAHLLYGFASTTEKNLFRLLTTRVSGVGPKLGLAILSGVGVDEFWNIVRAGDIARLSRIPGIGKKTAERLILEMRDRADHAPTVAGVTLPAGAGRQTPTTPLDEARSALAALGYKPAEVQRFTDAVYQEGMSTEQIIQEALRRAVR